MSGGPAPSASYAIRVPSLEVTSGISVSRSGGRLARLLLPFFQHCIETFEALAHADLHAGFHHAVACLDARQFGIAAIDRLAVDFLELHRVDGVAAVEHALDPEGLHHLPGWLDLAILAVQDDGLSVRQRALDLPFAADLPVEGQHLVLVAVRAPPADHMFRLRKRPPHQLAWGVEGAAEGHETLARLGFDLEVVHGVSLPVRC